MARFKSAGQQNNEEVVRQIEQQVSTQAKKYPFQNPYACAEGSFVYVNLESVEGLSKGMVTLRDLALIIDMSGSMQRYYRGGQVQDLVKTIVELVAPYDDDGVDLYFFANGLVHHDVVSNVGQVKGVIDTALSSSGAYGTTMPTGAFKEFCNQIKSKGRAGTVLFLTDGAMDDGGKELKSFYQNYLHTEFKTRDNFYCYAIEFGSGANGALDVLDGLYKPDQGAEDLFDLESANELPVIANVLAQVGGMSAIGSDVPISMSVEGQAVIDMVNSDLIEGGMKSVDGAMNKNMSIRVNTNEPTILTLKVQGYDEMKLKVTPQGLDVDLQIL